MAINNRNTQPRTNWRRPMASGFSLVELIVSMTGGAAVFCLAIATIEQTMKLSSQSRARAEHQFTVARLGQQFRSDVHQVREFHLEGALRLTTDAESTITYTVIGSTVTREVTKVDSSTESRETYRLHKECNVRLESKDGEHVTLLVVRQPSDGGELLENRIGAHTGRLFYLQSLRKGQ